MFLLYSTLGCHLCDEAVAILKVAGLSKFDVVDISDDECLFAEYGVKIPVIVYLDGKSNGKKELAWPFDLLSAREYIRSCK
mgnify:CR=1 FL=1